MIVFNKEKHEYTLDGNKLPSVTHILQKTGFYDFDMVKPEIIEAAADFGKCAHKGAELYDLNDLDERALARPLKPYLESWKRFREDTGFIPIEIEKPVYSKKYRYAGTPDRIGTIGNAITVVEIKSTAQIDRVSAIQAIAYLEAYNEDKPLKEKATKRMVVQLCPDGMYRLPKKDFFKPTDFNTFLAALTVYNFHKSRR
jgi:hypothetical protein